MKITAIKNDDGTIEVHATSVENETIFYVQTTGGQFSPQMGCQIHTIEDFEDFCFEGTVYEGVEGEIISEAERFLLAEIEEEEDIGNWEAVSGLPYDAWRRTSATTTTDIILQKFVGQKNNKKDGDYRLIVENSGYASPNDYAQNPDFKVSYFSNLDDAINSYSDFEESLSDRH